MFSSGSVAQLKLGISPFIQTGKENHCTIRLNYTLLEFFHNMHAFPLISMCAAWKGVAGLAVLTVT